jgi:hypothetical protein
MMKNQKTKEGAAQILKEMPDRRISVRPVSVRFEVPTPSIIRQSYNERKITE